MSWRKEVLELRNTIYQTLIPRVDKQGKRILQLEDDVKTLRGKK